MPEHEIPRIRGPVEEGGSACPEPSRPSQSDQPSQPSQPSQSEQPSRPSQSEQPSQPWRWRWRMAERLAAGLDPRRHGVVGCYLIGSTKHACARVESDLDLVIHHRAGEAQLRRLERYLRAWSRWLGIANSLFEGVHTPALLDAHLVTDEDVERRSSFAAHLGSPEDPARELPVGGGASP